MIFLVFYFKYTHNAIVNRAKLLEQDLMSSAQFTLQKNRALLLWSHPPHIRSGHRLAKDIHDQKETTCRRSCMHSEPSWRVAVLLPFLSALVKSLRSV